MKAGMQRTPTTSIEMIDPDLHFVTTPPARVKGTRMRARIAMIYDRRRRMSASARGGKKAGVRGEDGRETRLDRDGKTHQNQPNHVELPEQSLEEVPLRVGRNEGSEFPLLTSSSLGEPEGKDERQSTSCERNGRRSESARSPLRFEDDFFYNSPG